MRGVCVTQIRAALLTLDGPCFFCRTPSRPYAFIGVRASFPEIIGQNSKRKSSCAWITRVFFSATLAKVSKAIRCKVGEALHGCATDLVLQLLTVLQPTGRRLLPCILDRCQHALGMKCMKLNENMAGTLHRAHFPCT